MKPKRNAARTDNDATKHRSFRLSLRVLAALNELTIHLGGVSATEAVTYAIVHAPHPGADSARPRPHSTARKRLLASAQNASRFHAEVEEARRVVWPAENANIKDEVMARAARYLGSLSADLEAAANNYRELAESSLLAGLPNDELRAAIVLIGSYEKVWRQAAEKEPILAKKQLMTFKAEAMAKAGAVLKALVEDR